MSSSIFGKVIERTIHLLKWENLSKPKDLGGWGIKNMALFSTALRSYQGHESYSHSCDSPNLTVIIPSMFFAHFPESNSAWRRLTQSPWGWHRINHKSNFYSRLIMSQTQFDRIRLAQFTLCWACVKIWVYLFIFVLVEYLPIGLKLLALLPRWVFADFEPVDIALYTNILSLGKGSKGEKCLFWKLFRSLETPWNFGCLVAKK